MMFPDQRPFTDACITFALHSNSPLKNGRDMRTSGSSSSTPIHLPGWNLVSPTKRTVPLLFLPTRETRCPTFNVDAILKTGVSQIIQPHKVRSSLLYLKEHVTFINKGIIGGGKGAKTSREQQILLEISSTLKWSSLNWPWQGKLDSISFFYFNQIILGWIYSRVAERSIFGQKARGLRGVK